MSYVTMQGNELHVFCLPEWSVDSGVRLAVRKAKQEGRSIRYIEPTAEQLCAACPLDVKPCSWLPCPYVGEVA
ncbi:hypothetical protein [Halodesulfovibrio sp.]|uniref:hypothetical protein n=1 Tax=Halodesulfovibrio sp. TaxID=1912772 RepID=UPI0025BF2B7D|nr:hypothetical protein [Halodesulfovibrio sp.]